MTITFVLREFPKTSETFIRSQIEGLVARGHHVRILSLRTPPQKVHSQIPSGIDEIQFAGLSRNTLKTTIRTFMALLRSAFSRNITSLMSVRSRDDIILLPHLTSTLITGADVVVVHFGDLAYQYAVLAERFGLTVPFAAVLHGVDVARHLPSLSDGERSRLWRGIAVGLPVSRYWRDRLIDLGCPDDKLIVHHMGIDTDRFRPRAFVPVDGPFTLMTVCRLVEKKGIDTALRALADTGGHSSIHYHIVGDGPEHGRLVALAHDLGIDAAVTFHGALLSNEVASLLASADAFILTSKTAANGDMEGIPVSLMEAMASGLPVISTRHSGIPELVEDGVSGLLADEDDVAAVAAAIRRLMDDRSLGATLGAAARERVTDAFNSTTLSAGLEDILSRMAATETVSGEAYR